MRNVNETKQRPDIYFEYGFILTMRNVNVLLLITLYLLSPCFILTMRNVNTGREGIKAISLPSFILTMRNVNN